MRNLDDKARSRRMARDRANGPRRTQARLTKHVHDRVAIAFSCKRRSLGSCDDGVADGTEITRPAPATVRRLALQSEGIAASNDITLRHDEFLQ
jgi:hypothetical protein